MKIALIGGSGFIGTFLAKRLLSSGHEVWIVDKRRSAAFPRLWVAGDVRDRNSLAGPLEGCGALYNLAAEHKDNVLPRSLYHEVNVVGARNVCDAAAMHAIEKIVFTSSVAVYGFAPPDTDESGDLQPFNEYGRTKMVAEQEYRRWWEGDPRRSLTIVRPTVVFGPRNRGNVYNLIHQMASGGFAMIGDGRNVKSIAYVENVSAFLEYALDLPAGSRLYNLVDKPDLDMNELVGLVRSTLGLPERIRIRLPYVLGYLGGLGFDLLSALSRREFPVSAIRVRKFCATTQFRSSRVSATGFSTPIPLREGLRRTIEYEFLRSGSANDTEAELFESE